VVDSTAALATVPWVRNERSAVAGAKTTSYAENVVALAWARERGADEALFLDTRGHVCEGTGSNVFWVRDGRIVTPALTTGCLAGVTRGLVVQWCRVEEVEASFREVADAEEVFVTSSTRDVQAVRSLDGRTYAAPGPVTVLVAQEFSKRSAEQPDP
jgi:branched-chain amino acid aminotransferase